MSESDLMTAMVGAWLLVAVVVFAVLLFVTAPYGRHARRDSGPALPSRLGWLLMESPAALIVALWFILSPAWGEATAGTFVAMWELHYVYRAFIYPFRLRDAGNRMPVTVVTLGACFNIINGALNSAWLFSISGVYDAGWLTDPRFLAGLAIFTAGMVVNRHADGTLRHLRNSRERGYRIPAGGLYRWVSSPNYLGEIVEWIGWAIATWSLPGLAFAVWTAANLAPRARANHRWYQQRFDDYPAGRAALIPRLW